MHGINGVSGACTTVGIIRSPLPAEMGDLSFVHTLQEALHFNVTTRITTLVGRDLATRPIHLGLVFAIRAYRGQPPCPVSHVMNEAPGRGAWSSYI